jgi:ABC-type Na+ transport system ATPase subunit NatA
MLQAHELTKRYGGQLALDRVSFELRPGEIVGYLGPNGSGKSTTVNLVVGPLEPSAGDLSLCGIRASEDPIAYKRRIGYVPEEPSLYAHLTASDYLMLVGRLRRMPSRTLRTRVPELLRLFQPHDSRYRSMTTFSKGMRQRVLVASALLHIPVRLVLDEPFSGLDVNAGLLLRILLRIRLLSAVPRRPYTISTLSQRHSARTPRCSLVRFEEDGRRSRVVQARTFFVRFSDAPSSRSTLARGKRDDQRRSTKAARFSSDDLKPASWSALLMPFGTSSAVTVTIVPSAAVSNDHVIVISPVKAGSLDSNSTDCVMRRPGNSSRNRPLVMSVRSVVLPASVDTFSSYRNSIR